uniref:KH domain-containing protein At4g18375 n=1 Tax=Anthurium amnicola TaxID=1678845 RepID=A0A1D1Z8D9_9ARAE
MEAPFVSPAAASTTPAKRTAESAAGVFGSSSAANGGPKRRPRDMLKPLVVPPGHAHLRLLCHVAHIGGVIGKSGAVVKQLEQETAAKIRVDDVVPDCDERVVHVVGPERPKRSVPVADPAQGGAEDAVDGGVEVEVSAAQEAALRVFERALGMAEEVDGLVAAGGGGVTCKLLAAMGQVGSLMGKGGKNIEKVRKDTGARIRVLTSENIPACASPSDEVVQITGDALAVKKALVAICDCLQNNPPSDKAQTINRTPLAVPNVLVPDVHTELSHRNSFPAPAPGSSFDYISRGRPAPIGVDRLSISDQKKKQEEVSFRLLCSNDKIGGVIGKGGTIVKALEIETGTSIDVGATVAESEERVITISALETLESRFSPAQNAVVRVFTRSFEVGIKKGLDSGLDKSVTARLLILPGQVGCLMGRGGTIISDMRKVTGTGIRILGGDQVPKCSAEGEELIQITGELSNVQDALFRVTGRLRDNALSAKVPNSAGTGVHLSNLPQISSYGRNAHSSSRSHPAMGVPRTFDPRASLAHSMDHLGLSGNVDRPPSPTAWTPQGVSGNPRLITDDGRGLSTLRGGVELGSGSKTAIVTNTTVELAVAEHLIRFVYGENSANLNRIRQISGAKVLVHDPIPGSREGTVIISGNPDQALAAQSLIQAFILGGRSSSDSHLQPV